MNNSGTRIYEGYKIEDRPELEAKEAEFMAREHMEERSKNDLHPFDYQYSSDQDLKAALAQEEKHNMHFENPDPYAYYYVDGRDEPVADYVSHVGFNSIGDLDNYIDELQAAISEFKTKWRGTETQQGLNERLEELNEQIEAKYANYRNGASREADPDIEKLEEEYLDLLELQEKEIAKVQELTAKIKTLQEARKRWMMHNKDRYRQTIKERTKIYKQLEAAKKELKDLLAEARMHGTTLHIKERIEQLENEIIPDLEDMYNNFYKNSGFKVREDEPREDDVTNEETVTVSFDLNGGSHDEYDYSPITFTKGDPSPRPDMDPELDEEHVFDCWTLNGEPYDFTQPVNENITLKARYKELHLVTYFDKKGNELETIKVPHGEPIENIKVLDDKKFSLFDGWVTEDKEKFDPRTPIESDIDLTAKFKKDWKKIAAVGAGLATGAIAKGLDVAIPELPGLASGIAFGVTGVGAAITQFKLKNHKAVTEVPQEASKFKKASEKLKNYFRNNKNIQNLRTYFLTAAAATGLSAASEWIGAAINKPSAPTPSTPTPSNPTPSNPTPTPTSEPTLGDYDPNAIGSVYDSSLEAAQGVSAETPIREFFNAGFPTEAMDTTTGIRVPVTPDMTQSEILQQLGSSDLDSVAFNVTNNGQPVAWINAGEVFKDLADSVGGLSI